MRVPWLVVWGAFPLVGCAELADSLGAVQVPEVAVSRADLTVAPTADALAGYACEVNFGERVCEYEGFVVPEREDLAFGLDLVLSIDNLDDTETLSLADLFLTFSPFEPYFLGAACFSFCDPDEPGCAPELDADGACRTDVPDDALTPDVVDPTLDGLLLLTADPDEVEANGVWRAAPPARTTEAHVLLDLGIDPMLEASFDTASTAMLLQYDQGLPAELSVPFVVEGSATFRTADGATLRVDLAPLTDAWVLESAAGTPSE